MGIHGLFKFIEKAAPKAITRRRLAEYSGSVIPIDANLAIHSWCEIGASRNIRNRAGKYINHVQGIFFRSVSMLELGITPLYVFDGRPPDAKAAVLTARRQRALAVPADVFAECKTVLTMMGVPWIDAPGEADAQMAYMTRLGAAIPAAMSEDSDLLAFGARRLLRRLKLDGPRSTVIEIDFDVMLAELGLTHEQFVDFCLMIGSDYTTTKMAPRKALAEARAGKAHERRGIFMNHPVSRVRTCDLALRKKSRAELIQLRTYLTDVHGITAKKVDRGVAALARHYGVAL